jgi:CTP synthase (UTP-ammonia lyase)
MPEISKTHMGGTMRLGLRPTIFEPGTESWSRTRKLYAGAGIIWERHRHRYEVNPEYVKQLNDSGLVFAGKDEKGERMQLLELTGTFYAQIGEFKIKLMHSPSLTSRSPLLHRSTSSSRVLHSSFESITAIPRIRCRSFRATNT